MRDDSRLPWGADRGCGESLGEDAALTGSQSEIDAALAGLRDEIEPARERLHVSLPVPMEAVP